MLVTLLLIVMFVVNMLSVFNVSLTDAGWRATAGSCSSSTELSNSENIKYLCHWSHG